MSGLKEGVAFYRDSTSQSWLAPARAALPDLVAPATSRSNPDRGQYVPNDPLYTGLLPGWTPAMLDPVYPTTSGGAYNPTGYINITSPGPYVNKIFWGQVRMASSTLPVFRNCVFAGHEPSWLPSSVYGSIQCYGTSGRQWLVEDSLIDDGMWMRTDVPSIPHTPFDFSTWQINKRRSVGVHGGRGTLRRTEVRNVQDGWNSAANITVEGNSIYEDAFTAIEDCWFHDGMYYRDINVMPTLHEGTHCDAFQTGVGRNYSIVGTYFGGRRDPAGYGAYFNGAAVDPSDPAYGSYGYNSGDDFWNSCFQIKQETDTTRKNLVTNFQVEECFFEGGTYCINMTTTPGLLDSTDGESFVRNNYFIRRTDSKYVIRKDEYADLFTNNRIVDLDGAGGFAVGAAINYTRG